MYVDIEKAQMGWRDIYKLCIGFINPRPIALVSSLDPEGHANLAPFSFYNLVSANPPVVIFSPSFRRDKTSKDTLLNVEATGEFVVATVTSDINRQSTDCAAMLPYGESEFDFAKLTPAPATKVKPALVKEAKVNIECKLNQIVRLGAEPGAGSVIFGNIVAIHLDDDILGDDGIIDPHKLRTVGRLGNQWYSDVTEPYETLIPEVGE